MDNSNTRREKTRTEMKGSKDMSEPTYKEYHTMHDQWVSGRRIQVHEHWPSQRSSGKEKGERQNSPDGTSKHTMNNIEQWFKDGGWIWCDEGVWDRYPGDVRDQQAMECGEKWRYQMMMDIMFKNLKTAYSSAEAARDCNSQPDGNLLTVVGNGAGRAHDMGGDKWRRYCWQTIRGARDEGIVVITEYQVCHEARDKPGPFTV